MPAVLAVERQESPYVRVEGHLDLDSAQAMLGALAKRLRGDVHLFIDVSRIESCDGGGLEMFRRLRDVAAYRGASIRLVRPCPRMRVALARAGLTDVVLF